jgi:hypothetical protein
MDEFDLIRDHRHLPPEALMESTVPSDESPLGAVMQRRAEMQRALRDLSAALDEPHQAQPELWQKRIRDSLTALAADFEAHLRVTEGPGGLHEQVVRTAPRLAHAVSVLTQEHVQLAEQLNSALARSSTTITDPIDSQRSALAALISAISRHRQHGADLVFEAFESDLGGED